MPGSDTQMPSSLRAHAPWQRLAPGGVPAMLVHLHWESATPAPVVLWMHGRTVNKELDPGRYLRWLRAGIATCTVDLPGHGERFEAALQEPERAMEVVMGLLVEIDGIVDASRELDIFDLDRAGIGGTSPRGHVPGPQPGGVAARPDRAPRRVARDPAAGLPRRPRSALPGPGPHRVHPVRSNDG